MPRYEEEDEYGEDFGGVGQRYRERREDSREKSSSRGERSEGRVERSDRARPEEKAREMTLGARAGRTRPDESPKRPRKEVIVGRNVEDLLHIPDYMLHPERYQQIDYDQYLPGHIENSDQKLNWDTMRGPSNERTQALTDKAGVRKKDSHPWGYPYQRQYPPPESDDTQKDGKEKAKGKEKA